MTMKHTILYLIIGLWGLAVPCRGQQTFQDFRNEAGDHSAIYSGKVAYTYSKQRYANVPYWETEEYRTGTLSFEGRVYTDVQLRYDPFRKALNVLSPVNRVSVVADARKVDYFILNGVRFVPDAREGFILELHDGKYVKLISKVNCGAGQDEVKNNVSFRSFKTKEIYTLTVDGVSYDVKKRSSFIKRFPDHKKQLKRYAKENELDFSDHKRESFTALARYAETLIKADRHEQ